MSSTTDSDDSLFGEMSGIDDLFGERARQPESQDAVPPIKARRLAFVDLLFSWPPNGGADADLYNVVQGLQAAGHEVHLFVVHEVGSTDRGLVDPSALPFPATRLNFSRRELRPETVTAALRESVDGFNPDLVFVMHGFALKPYVLEALAHHRTIARYYAHEHVCLRDSLRWRDSAACPHSYLTTPDVCRRCALAHQRGGITSGDPTTWTVDWIAARAYAPAYHALYLRALASTHAIIVSNMALANDLAGVHERVYVLPGGVHVASVPVTAAPARAPESKKFILMVGRVDDPLKGLATLMEAGRRLAQVRRDFKIVATHFDHTLSRDWFVALGWRDHAGAMALYPQADICVVPSIWEEPFGLVAVEAMAASRPVIASKVGGLQDIVRDGHTGYLFPPGDATSLAECLEILLDRPELRMRMGRVGRQVVEAEYDWGAIIQTRYLPLIERLLA